MLYYGDKPWLLDIGDNPYSLAGYKYDFFIKNKKKIEDTLLRDNCKAITCANETAYNLMKKLFPKKILEKTTIIHNGVKFFKIDKKKEDKLFFQILFMGSSINPDDFFHKGGLETLEVFKKLSRKYSNIKLIIRCKLPRDIKEKYSMKNVIFIEEIIPYEKIINLYRDSDILLMPGHTACSAYYEAMSFGLPIVALDTCDTKDIVQNGKSGFLVKRSDKIPYDSLEYPLNVRSKIFVDSIKKIDQDVIKNLSEKVEILIKDSKLRQDFGKEGRKIIKTKFSIKQRNKKLKKILDKI